MSDTTSPQGTSLENLPTNQLIDRARALHARLMRVGMPYLRQPENFRDAQSRRKIPRRRLQLGEVMEELRRREPQTAQQLESELKQAFGQGDIRCRRRKRPRHRRAARKRKVQVYKNARQVRREARASKNRTE